VQAGIKNEKSKIEEILRYLVDLRSSWEVAIAKAKSEKCASAAPAAELAGWSR
jgi:flagellin-specific chaperone FliS